MTYEVSQIARITISEHLESDKKIWDATAKVVVRKWSIKIAIEWINNSKDLQ